MGLVTGTSSAELYRLLAELSVDIGTLRKKKPSYKELGTLYLDLLDKKISEPQKVKPPFFDLE